MRAGGRLFEWRMLTGEIKVRESIRSVETMVPTSEPTAAQVLSWLVRCRGLSGTGGKLRERMQNDCVLVTPVTCTGDVADAPECLAGLSARLQSELARLVDGLAHADPPKGLVRRYFLRTLDRLRRGERDDCPEGISPEHCEIHLLIFDWWAARGFARAAKIDIEALMESGRLSPRPSAN